MSIKQTTNGLNNDGSNQVESKDSITWTIYGFKRDETLYEISSGSPHKNQTTQRIRPRTHTIQIPNTIQMYKNRKTPQSHKKR